MVPDSRALNSEPAELKGTSTNWEILDFEPLGEDVLGTKLASPEASKLLSRNLWIYGLGGIIVPFVGIKLLDLAISHIPGIG